MQKTSVLDATYDRVQRRILGFDNVSQEDKDRAWGWLKVWRRQLVAHHGAKLPAPYAYANDFGEVEFEWETERGELVLRLCGYPNSFGYLLVTNGEEREGTAGVGDVCPLLAQILG
jgi:hypothetical protein